MKTRLVVKRKDFTRYSNRFPRGSGYCEDQWTEQWLVKQWVFMGRVVWWRVVDRELVPAHAVVSMSAYGDTGGWRSKFSDYL